MIWDNFVFLFLEQIAPSPAAHARPLLLENKHKSSHVLLSGERILFIHSAKLKKFSALKNIPFLFNQSIKVHRRALIFLLCLISCHHSQLSPVDHAAWQHPRESPRYMRGSARILDVRMAQFVLKIEKNVLYHGSARIPRLTVSVPVCGSWFPPDTICMGYWPSVRSRWLDIGQVLFLRVYGPRWSRGP